LTDGIGPPYEGITHDRAAFFGVDEPASPAG